MRRLGCAHETIKKQERIDRDGVEQRRIGNQQNSKVSRNAGQRHGITVLMAGTVLLKRWRWQVYTIWVSGGTMSV